MTGLRLGLLALAPIHYHAPLYRLLAKDPRVEFKAIFCTDAGVRPADLGYGRPVAWGGDLLNGYEHAFLSRAGSNQLRGFFSLRDRDVVGLLRQERFDVLWLHGYNYATHQLAAQTQRSLGCGVMFREEQTLLHPRSLPKTIVKEVGLRLALRGAVALYIGTESKRWFEHYGVPPERLFFTPYTVDNHRLQLAHAELAPRRPELRRSFGISDDDGPVIITVARLARAKQPDLVVEAFDRVRRDQRCALLIVGAGPMEGDLRREVAARQTPDVHFAGFLDQTEISRAYAAADVFTLFSARHETWGIVVNEAMNFRLPLLVSDMAGSSRDLVHPCRNGFRISPQDPGELARRMTELVADAGLRKRMGDQSLEIIEEWRPELTAAGVIAGAYRAAGRARGGAPSAGLR